jgi:hypothetical protein
MGEGRQVLSRLRFIGLLAALVLGTTLIAAAPASATFHLIKVREVFPGTAAQPDSDYVELQAYSPFQNQVQFGQLRIYNANGTTASTFTPAGPLAVNANQMTVLIADSAFGTVFPGGVTPDSTDSSLNLSPAAGAVCWPVNSTPIDCVSWGASTGDENLPSTAGSPFQGTGASGAIGDGKAISRSISANCSTALDDADDTANSAADFSEVTPNPRQNSAPISEASCSGAGPSVVPNPVAPPAKKKKCKKRKKASGAGSGTSGAAPAYAAKKKCKKKRK